MKIENTSNKLHNGTEYMIIITGKINSLIVWKFVIAISAHLYNNFYAIFCIILIFCFLLFMDKDNDEFSAILFFFC